MKRVGEILVVGCGLAGLTAAVALKRRGFEVDLVERREELRDVGAGILLHPNALRQLRSLGIELEQDGAHIERQLVFGDGAGNVSDLRWESVWGTGQLPLAIQRHRLAGRLLSRVGPEAIQWGREPTALTPRDDRVEVEFNRGPGRSYRVVLGADGINSGIRQRLDPAARPQYLGQTYWRLTTPAHSPFDFPEWRVWRSGGHFFGAAPVGSRRAHVFLQAALAEPPADLQARAYASLLEVAAKLGAAVLALAEAIDPDTPIHVGPAHAVAANTWARGRICLLGDAAHAASPVLSQGGAMAIEDAAVVATELSRHGLAPRALATYVERRSLRVAHVQRMSRLHLMLTQSGLTGGERVAKKPETGPVGWYRTLYGPLREAA